MKRNIIAVITAIITGGVVVFVMDALAHFVYPVPPGLDLSRPEAISDYMKSVPVGALLLVAFSQTAGALSGGFISGIISKKITVALVYGVIALCLGVMNLLVVPHPIWLAVLLMLLPIPSAIIGFQLARFLGALS